MTEEQIEKEAERYAGNLVDELDKNHSLFTVARSDLFNHHYHDWKAGYHFRDQEFQNLFKAFKTMQKERDELHKKLVGHIPNPFRKQ